MAKRVFEIDDLDGTVRIVESLEDGNFYISFTDESGCVSFVTMTHTDVDELVRFLRPNLVLPTVMREPRAVRSEG